MMILVGSFQAIEGLALFGALLSGGGGVLVTYALIFHGRELKDAPM